MKLHCLDKNQTEYTFYFSESEADTIRGSKMPVSKALDIVRDRLRDQGASEFLIFPKKGQALEGMT